MDLRIHMDERNQRTRRDVLRVGSGITATAVGLGTVGSATGRGKQFGRVYANGVLWRTNVVRTNDERFEPDDALFFIHGGDPDEGGDGRLQPAVSESAPGDGDYNGGKWTHYGTAVVERETYEREYRPITSESELRRAEADNVVEITVGKPYDGAPPNYFLCPLNGRA